MRKSLLAILPLFLFTISSTSAFSDVSHDDIYESAIATLAKDKVITGNKDGTFLPEKKMNRAEFVTMIVRSKVGEPEKPIENCFKDVKKTDWFAPYICYMKDKGYSKGYKDGMFGTKTTINLAEGMKMMALLYDLPVRETAKKEPWYIPYLDALEDKSALPPTFQSIGQPLSKNEVAEVIYRLKYNKTQEISVTVASLSTSPCQPFYEYNPKYTIDTKKVRDTWIAWYNKERSALGKPLLTEDINLDITSITWSKYAKKRGYIDHKRPGTTAYYDYKRILKWFSDFGLNFPLKGRASYGESIAWNRLVCEEKDCTNDLISTMKKAYNFFYNEKGSKYKPHYDMMINGNYKKIGLGIVIDEENDKMWLTTHLATDVISKNLPYCTGNKK